MLQAATGKDKLLYECVLELEDARPWKDRWVLDKMHSGLSAIH